MTYELHGLAYPNLSLDMGSYQSLFPIFMNGVSIGEDLYQSSREIRGVSDAFLEGCDFSGLMHVISQIEKFAVIIIIF